MPLEGYKPRLQETGRLHQQQGTEMTTGPCSAKRGPSSSKSQAPSLPPAPRISCPSPGRRRSHTRTCPVQRLVPTFIKLPAPFKSTWKEVERWPVPGPRTVGHGALWNSAVPANPRTKHLLLVVTTAVLRVTPRRPCQQNYFLTPDARSTRQQKRAVTAVRSQRQTHLLLSTGAA